MKYKNLYEATSVRKKCVLLPWSFIVMSSVNRQMVVSILAGSFEKSIESFENAFIACLNHIGALMIDNSRVAKNVDVT